MTILRTFGAIYYLILTSDAISMPFFTVSFGYPFYPLNLCHSRSILISIEIIVNHLITGIIVQT